jgi:hypothetical protein
MHAKKSVQVAAEEIGYGEPIPWLRITGRSMENVDRQATELLIEIVRTDNPDQELGADVTALQDVAGDADVETLAEAWVRDARKH